MFINITKSADAGLLAIADYLAQDDFDEAERIVRAIVEAVYSLQNLPNRGRPGHRRGTRELALTPLPYVVVYSVKDDAVEILHIYHGAQDWR